MEIYGLYCVCARCDEEIRYVGLTTKDAITRLKKHKSESRSDDLQTPKARWVRKHGEENIRVKVLDKSSSFPELRKKETEWIKKMKTFNSTRGLNLTEGGEGMRGYKFDQEVRKRFRERTREQFRSKHPRKILTDDEASRIRKRLWEGEYPEDIHREYPEVTVHTIRKLEQRNYRPEIPFPSTERVIRVKREGANRGRFGKGELKKRIREMYPKYRKSQIADMLGVSASIVTRYTK